MKLFQTIGLQELSNYLDSRIVRKDWRYVQIKLLYLTYFKLTRLHLF